MTRTFPVSTRLEDVPAIIVDGREYVPFAANRIDEDLAQRRRAMGGWSERACTPGLIVEFKAADSLAVSALGRCGR